jgi:hypothetical protein
METPEEKETYKRRYHLQRALKPVLRIDSHKRTIDMPEGMELGKTDQKRVDALVNDFGYVIQAVIPIETFEKLIINGGKGIRGLGLLFRQDKFFGLAPGTAVDQIGKGKETGSNRVDEFVKPATYIGSIIIENEKLYAFRVNPALVPNPPTEYYILYESTKYEVSRQIFKKNGDFEYTRFFKPEFKLAKPVKQDAKQKKLNL